MLSTHLKNGDGPNHEDDNDDVDIDQNDNVSSIVVKLEDKNSHITWSAGSSESRSP